MRGWMGHLEGHSVWCVWSGAEFSPGFQRPYLHCCSECCDFQTPQVRETLRAPSAERTSGSWTYGSIGVNGLELGTHRCLWQHPGGRHSLGTVKGVFLAASAGPQNRQMGSSGCWVSISSSSRAQVGCSGQTAGSAAPPSPGTLVTMETNSCLEGLAVGCFSSPPNPYVEVGGGPGGVWGRGIPQLPLGPPPLQREAFLVSKGRCLLLEGGREGSPPLSAGGL